MLEEKISQLGKEDEEENLRYCVWDLEVFSIGIQKVKPMYDKNRKRKLTNLPTADSTS